ncbi:Non-hemolytic phospholipase C [Tolypocladium capitatum]|uniref:Non-hemolytic phospholipase C n=1 Tax=Tolypocladium capitatum TaxID=45235 RepID=A0A2K3QH44_9HYPO|nr:Non-hemolytic phospholipase C [Tolypocladium capitatum]
MRPRRLLLAAALAVGPAVHAESLEDIKHIVLFMQENRAFDHYYGTMAGVRGFADPNVQVNPDGRSVFEQPISPAQNGVDILKPWHLNYLGGEWVNATQCMGAGDNGWGTMHAAYNGGLGNNWNVADGGYSMGYYTRADLPTHFDIVEGWTILDMSTQSLLAATDPNRIHWMSGSTNIPGSPSNPDGKGGMIIDNSATPGCERPGLNCFPFVWKTFPEYLEEAGVSWQVWQDFDNFEDNMLAYFEQYQLAPKGSALRQKGNSYPGLNAFFDRAANGTLPQVSWIVGPQELAEHPPNMPIDGAWLQKKVVDAITNSPAYNETVLIISYDEQGGWADHVVPDVPDRDTPGEWMQDPYNQFGYVPVGPGWRTPRYIISPWTRGGYVFTERADHSSDILFVEQWAAANGYSGVYSNELTQWRRDHMSNLVNAFDFNNPDYSIPPITQARTPEPLPNEPSRYTGNLTLGSLTGPWVGPARCLSDYKAPNPPIPYGRANANQILSQLVEEGFKPVRGQLTEGRYLTFEIFGNALTNIDGCFVGISRSTERHEDIRQRWVIHAAGGSSNDFFIQSAQDEKYIASLPSIGSLTSDIKGAQAFTISYNVQGSTYSLRLAQTSNSFVSVDSQTNMYSSQSPVRWEGALGLFNIFSVSYH